MQRPAFGVREVFPGSFEIHVLRSNYSGNFISWTGSTYAGSGNPSASRAVADLMWSYVMDVYSIVAEGGVTYNGIRDYVSSDPNQGRIGGEI